MSPPRTARTGYMSLKEAAAWLGLGADRAAVARLRRRIETSEEEHGKRYLVRVGSSRRPRLYVTRAGLQDCVPEHWSVRDRTQKAVSAKFADLTESLALVRIAVKQMQRSQREVEAWLRANTRYPD